MVSFLCLERTFEKKGKQSSLEKRDLTARREMLICSKVTNNPGVYITQLFSFPN